MDERGQYLRQLIEMGERELILGGTAVRENGGTNSDADGGTDHVPPDRRTAEPPAHVPPDRRTAVPPSGGPAMYPPGLDIQGPPTSDMFVNDPIKASDRLEQLAELIEACRRCSLGHTRRHTVPGEGNPNADFVCVGEAPGATEDETGRPFVGRAGQLLNDILKAIGLAREDIFIVNVLKCRPPGNRDPEPLEAQACSPYLHRQLELIRPKVILALGKPAATTLLNVPRTTSLGELRGRVHRYRGTPLVVTYHPAALLRNPHWKAATWDDVRVARRILDGEAF